MQHKFKNLLLLISLFGMFSKTIGQQLYQRTIDINRLPINILFIKDGQKSVGFIIAGHAYKDICRLASWEVKNFLDSMGYQAGSFFSFGVGFDLRNEDQTGTYNKRLNELRASFEWLEMLDPTQVRVSQITKASFEHHLKNFRDNFMETKHSMETNRAVNRVILKYDVKDISLPVPFYMNDTIVQFSVPKSVFGKIPSYIQFENDLLEKAVQDVQQAIEDNNLALRRLNSYDPVKIQTDIINDTFKVTYNTGLKKVTLNTLSQFDTTKWVKSFDPFTKVVTKFYSLRELRMKCNAGQSTMSLGVGNYKREINICEMVRSAYAQIKDLREDQQYLYELVNNQNKSLNKYLQKLSSYKNTISEKKKVEDHSLEIDGFLRGWYFNAGDKIINVELDKWYLKRSYVWKQILSNNPEFNQIITSRQVIPQDLIAGIFQSDDVFFSVKENGNYFEISPYKMLSGEIVQVIDKQNSVCQFFTANNYRLLKLYTYEK